MAFASPNRVARFLTVIAVLLLAAGQVFAARGGGPSSRDESSSRDRTPPRAATPPDRGGSRAAPLLPGCWVATDGKVHYTDVGTGSEKIAEPFCNGPDGATVSVIKPICQPAKPPWSYKYQFSKGITSFDCPSGQVCSKGQCVVKQKPAGCLDSDFVGTSDTSMWGSWLDKYNPQVKTPGFVRMDDINNKPTFTKDRCKDNIYLYEQVCTTMPTANFQQSRKEVAMKCPEGYACKEMSIAKSAIINPGLQDIVAPIKAAAACVPKPDPCDPPWNDMCPNIEGCQKDPAECPPSKDICDSSLTKDQMQAKYGADTSIFPMSGGGWVADSCVTLYTIKHEWCENGVPKSGVSPCPPGTCSKGLCDNKQVPVPGPKTTADCEDTDIKGASNSFGKLDVFGLIKLKGKAEDAAKDICMTGKILMQFKCDATKKEGYSGNPFTCSGKDDCCSGACFTPKPAACSDYGGKIQPADGGVPFEEIHGVSGTSKTGNKFDVKDKCLAGTDKILKAVCDPDSCTGFKYKEEEFCPEGKVCKEGLCVPKFQKTCGPLPDGSGVGVIENEKTTEYKNKCSGAILISWSCGPDGNATSTVSTCPVGCDSSGICSNATCNDTDPVDNPYILGTVQWLENGNKVSDKDFCDSTGKLVQVLCVGNSKGYTQPAPCPTGQYCEAGVCKAGTNPSNTPPSDKCAGKDLSTPNKCQKGYCDPATGNVSFLDWIVCEPGKTCIPTTGTCTCTSKVCPAGQALNPVTCQCGGKLPVCYGMTCGAGQILDENTCTCKTTKPDDGKGAQSPPCSPNAPNGTCTTPGDICYNGKCTKDLCKSVMPTLPVDDPCNLYSCSSDTGKVSTYPKYKKETDPGKYAQCNDDDKDGILNDKDNCFKLYNPDQKDANQNSIGDVCELVLAAGYTHNCATFVDSDGKPNGDLKCWGSNTFGELGMGKTSPLEWTPQQVMKLPADPYATPTEKLTDVVAADGGYEPSHTCATTKTGEVYCWGRNYYGECGGDGWLKVPSAKSLQVSSAAEVAAGLGSSCVLTTDKRVLCLGWMEALDNPAAAKAIKDASGNELGNIGSIAGYRYTTCVVTTYGTVQCWGHTNKWVDDPFSEAVLLPTVIPADKTGKPLSNVLKMVLSINRGVCALLKDQTVWCKPPFKNELNKFTPIPLAGVTDIALSDKKICASVKDGNVYCWDVNWNCAYTNTECNSGFSTPELFTDKGIEGVTQLVAGSNHFCARVKDMSVKCWGDKSLGQLGLQPASLFGIPSCIVKDPYSGPGCADETGKSINYKEDTAFLTCDLYGNTACKPLKTGQQYIDTNSSYQISCPKPGTEGDKPTCVKGSNGGPKYGVCAGNPNASSSAIYGSVCCAGYLPVCNDAQTGSGKPICDMNTKTLKCGWGKPDPNVKPTCPVPGGPVQCQ